MNLAADVLSERVIPLKVTDKGAVAMAQAIMAMDAEIKRLSALSENKPSRDDVIEEVAQNLANMPLTYAGPDPNGIRDLCYLIISAVRDMKGGA